MRSLVYVFLFPGLSTIISGQHNSASKVNMTVFYETLCPYSMTFFTNQIEPTWRKLNNSINIELVPYGHATKTHANGIWKFECQHGDNECLYNIYHSCILEIIPDIDKVIEILSCLLSTKEEYSVLHECLKHRTSNEQKKEIRDCIRSDRGRELLAKHGERTNNFHPKIKYVPTTVFENVYNQEASDNAFHDLVKELCRHLNPKPRECPYNSITHYT